LLSSILCGVLSVLSVGRERGYWNSRESTERYRAVQRGTRQVQSQRGTERYRESTERYREVPRGTEREPLRELTMG
jgi:hypothetical protein